MGRPKIEWGDHDLRKIMDAMKSLDPQYPKDNPGFLAALIADIRRITGRLYGAGTYARLLRDVGPQCGIERTPSSATIQKAVAHAQALAPVEAAKREPGAADLPGVVSEVASVIREALGPLHALMADLASSRGGMDAAGADAMEIALTRAALEDAHARIRQLEQELAGTRRELGKAQAARDLAGEHVNQMLADLHDAIKTSGSSAAELVAAAKRLEGTEQFLKRQNDAVRVQISSEVEALKARNKSLQETVDNLTIQNDQYRRAMAHQREKGGH